MNETTIWGIYIGLAFSAIYVGCSFYRRTPPKLNQVATMLLATVGATVATDFGLIVLRSNDAFLGNLADYRLPMLLGALAIIWVSFESIIELYIKVWSESPPITEAHIQTLLQQSSLNTPTTEQPQPTKYTEGR